MAGFGVSVTIDTPALRKALQSLSELPKRRIKPACRQGVRAAARPVWTLAKNYAPRETGQLRRSLRVIARSDKAAAEMGEAGAIQATVTAISKKNKKTGRNANRYAHILEGGAAAHPIRPVKKKVLRFQLRSQVGRGKKNLVTFDQYAPAVQHPGTRATRFLSRAARAGQGAAVRAFAAKLRQAVEKYGNA